MNPDEKAQELYNKYSAIEVELYSYFIVAEVKNNALSEVDSQIEYWKQVKQEIENL